MGHSHRHVGSSPGCRQTDTYIGHHTQVPLPKRFQSGSCRQNGGRQAKNGRRGRSRGPDISAHLTRPLVLRGRASSAGLTGFMVKVITSRIDADADGRLIVHDAASWRTKHIQRGGPSPSNPPPATGSCSWVAKSAAMIELRSATPGVTKAIPATEKVLFFFVCAVTRKIEIGNGKKLGEYTLTTHSSSTSSKRLLLCQQLTAYWSCAGSGPVTGCKAARATADVVMPQDASSPCTSVLFTGPFMTTSGNRLIGLSWSLGKRCLRAQHSVGVSDRKVSCPRSPLVAGLKQPTC